MKMYVTRTWNTSINEVEVDRVTESSVWLAGKTSRDGKPKRKSREGRYRKYHDTHEQAVVYLLQRLKRDIESARGSIARARIKHQKAIDALNDFAAQHPTPAKENDE